jgi:hypothetical protein
MLMKEMMILVAMQCIGEAFGVDATDEAQKQQYSTKPATLLSIFDVYLKTKSKAAPKVFIYIFFYYLRLFTHFWDVCILILFCL